MVSLRTRKVRLTVEGQLVTAKQPIAVLQATAASASFLPWHKTPSRKRLPGAAIHGQPGDSMIDDWCFNWFVRLCWRSLKLVVQAMLGALKHRTLIIGNSGSGKSTLANRVATYAKCSSVDLDTIHWEDLALGVKRDEELSKQLTASIAAEVQWVIEGVYGWLADVAAPRTTALIWLNLPWEECKAGLEQRGPRRGATELQFNELMGWAERYWSRQTPSSFIGHSKIYDRFPGSKVALKSRAEAVDFAQYLQE
jgi:adenylate kinase family enzyme